MATFDDDDEDGELFSGNFSYDVYGNEVFIGRSRPELNSPTLIEIKRMSFVKTVMPMSDGRVVVWVENQAYFRVVREAIRVYSPGIRVTFCTENEEGRLKFYD